MTKKNPAADPVKAYLSEIGRKGGQSRSAKKIAAAAENARNSGGRPKGSKDKQPRKKKAKLMKRISHSKYELSYGLQFSANRGIVGIDQDTKVYEGYDGDVHTWPLDDWEIEAGRADEWTDADRVELTDHMIALWQRFKAQSAQKKIAFVRARRKENQHQ